MSFHTATRKISSCMIGVALCNRGPVTPAWAEQHPDLVWHGPRPKRGFSWRAFEPDQSAALAALLAELVSVHPLRWVVGHEDVTRGKGDPGPALSLLGLDWGALGLERLHRDWSSADTWHPGDRSGCFGDASGEGCLVGFLGLNLTPQRFTTGSDLNAQSPNAKLLNAYSAER
ncbi:N-acetylmuramoyl-L-alanine amidase [Nannocystis pusilla]|uniref:N-acetylmuramoyl-L-alanine amidase n=1 Tax=Nannocystis pusilla TaxID=889268 RepID=UPI003DA3F874